MIIGREKEKSILDKYYHSDESNFICLYGRRRVGKTYLIKNYFSNRFFLNISGVQNGSKSEQLNNFQYELKIKRKLKNWFDAFNCLREKIEQSKDNEKKVIFFDELAWLYTTKSDLIRALEYFWNQFCTGRKDILLIVCSSASSWIIDKIVNNTGGLYNRLSEILHIEPFTLNECVSYFEYKKIELNKFDILESYMVFGGVPYYYNFFRINYSLAQNIDYLFFSKDAPLKNEFKQLYASLYTKYENYLKIIETIGNKAKGLTRKEILKETGLEGGTLTTILNDLTFSGFIYEYINYGNIKKGSVFQLIDNFSVFYLSFKPQIEQSVENYYFSILNTPLLSAWKGYAFERVCFLEIKQIIKALEINGISTQTKSFFNNETQIDLIIDRADNIIDLVEIKYYNDEYVIDENYYKKLLKRKAVFINEIKTKKSVHFVFVSVFGLKTNMYSNIIQKSITINGLFN
ncbi:MAG: AAA family ATPase [Bacillales bacterium]|jgi:AAA+ ATPase superfamily predicted ATPase|nr:AAA family ATPase [Bacillales bacterium]